MNLGAIAAAKAWNSIRFEKSHEYIFRLRLFMAHSTSSLIRTLLIYIPVLNYPDLQAESVSLVHS